MSQSTKNNLTFAFILIIILVTSLVVGYLIGNSNEPTETDNTTSITTTPYPVPEAPQGSTILLPAEAAKIALERYPDTSITSNQLVDVGNIEQPPYYAISLNNGVELQIDAVTAVVTEL